MAPTPSPVPVTYPNLAPDPTCELQISLEVGPISERHYCRGGDIWAPDPGKTVLALFVFDCGTSRSLLSGSLALRLQLDLTEEPCYIDQVEGNLTVVPSRFRVAIGSDWIPVRCWVRCRADGTINPLDTSDNLLGLDGLLERYSIGLSKERVTFAPH